MTDGRPQGGEDNEYTPDDYNRVAGNANLVGITLMASDIEVKPEYFDPATKNSLSYDSGVATCDYDPNDGVISAWLKYAVNAKIGRKRVLKINAEYLVIYRSVPDLKPAAAEAFCAHVGKYAAYAYFRAWVSQVAGASNLRLPPLPTLSSVGRSPPKQESSTTL